jgi:hypothetical protein
VRCERELWIPELGGDEYEFTVIKVSTGAELGGAHGYHRGDSAPMDRNAIDVYWRSNEVRVLLRQEAFKYSVGYATEYKAGVQHWYRIEPTTTATAPAD